MEREIKILEERVITLKRHIKNYEESNCKTNVYQQLVKEHDAIVNVLHDLKYNKAQFETQLREKLDLQASSIPKSKIQNKIEKLSNEFNFYAGREHSEWQDGEFDGEMCDDIALQIKVLKELLESEDK